MEFFMSNSSGRVADMDWNTENTLTRGLIYRLVYAVYVAEYERWKLIQHICIQKLHKGHWLMLKQPLPASYATQLRITLRNELSHSVVKAPSAHNLSNKWKSELSFEPATPVYCPHLSHLAKANDRSHGGIRSTLLATNQA